MRQYAACQRHFLNPCAVGTIEQNSIRIGFPDGRRANLARTVQTEKNSARSSRSLQYPFGHWENIGFKLFVMTQRVTNYLSKLVKILYVMVKHSSLNLLLNQSPVSVYPGPYLSKDPYRTTDGASQHKLTKIRLGKSDSSDNGTIGKMREAD